MPIRERLARPGTRLGGLFALLLLLAEPAEAHPLAQGQLAIAIVGQDVRLEALVSREERAVFALSSGLAAAPAEEQVAAYGAYLGKHVRLSARGRDLAPRLRSAVLTAGGRARYQYEYQLPTAAPLGDADLMLSQDVLREFEFAPCNAWEAAYVVRLTIDNGPVITGLLATANRPLPLSAGPPGQRGGGAYLRLGLTHILGGWDHLLFVAALVLGAARLRDVVALISVFTVAHSITLALSTLDLVRVSPGLVEPMIAASIVVVALGNLAPAVRTRPLGRALVAGIFGLFHGLGFAGGLREALAGTAETHVQLGYALAAFSLGVELGHQLVILPTFLLLSVVRRRWARAGQAQVSPPVRWASAAVGASGLVYLVLALR